MELVAATRQTIVASWPHRFDYGELRNDISLGEGGLGLDSVEIVEVVLACEELCGRTAGEELFARELTVERIAEHFARA
jgi:acyl carrier protein